MADETKTVILEGQTYTVPKDATLEEIDSYIQSKSATTINPQPEQSTVSPVAQGIRQALTWPTGYTVSDIPQSVRPMVLPTALGLGGAAAGTAAPVLGPATPLLGEMAGSGLGEYINQKLGITEPSNLQIVGAAAAPGIGRTLLPMAKRATLAVAKTFGGRELIADIADKVAQKMLGPKTSAAKLYETARASGEYINPSNAAVAASTELTIESKMATSKISEAIKESLTPYLERFKAGNVPADQLIEESQRLSEEMGKAYNSGNTKLANAISRVRNALFQDFNESGIEAFKQASITYRKEEAIKELGHIIRQAKPLNAFKDAVDSDTLFGGAFSSAEKQQIEDMLTKLSGTTYSGFSGMLGRATTTYAGGHFGGPPGALLGAFASDIMASALSSGPGRSLLGKLLTSPGGFDYPKMAVLAQFVRAQSATSPEGQKSFLDTMRNKDISIQQKLESATKRSEDVKLIPTFPPDIRERLRHGLSSLPEGEG